MAEAWAEMVGNSVPQDSLCPFPSSPLGLVRPISSLFPYKMLCFAYKMHLLGEANYTIPLLVTLTPRQRLDSALDTAIGTIRSVIFLYQAPLVRQYEAFRYVFKPFCLFVSAPQRGGREGPPFRGLFRALSDRLGWPKNGPQ